MATQLNLDVELHEWVLRQVLMASFVEGASGIGGLVATVSMLSRMVAGVVRRLMNPAAPEVTSNG